MKSLLIFIALSVSVQLQAQIKKRDLGYFIGYIPSYTVNTGQDLLAVDSCELKIWLDKESITLKIDDSEYTGRYTVKEKRKRTYLIHAKLEYSDIEETIRIDGKKKSMWRKGLFPQPDTALRKLKKKEVEW